MSTLMSLLIPNRNNKPVYLTDIQICSIKKYNPDEHKFNIPKSIPFYREPLATEYPLNLVQIYKSCANRDRKMSPLYPALDYMMKENIERNYDFCTNRFTLQNMLRVSFASRTQWIATKFNGCIYLDTVEDGWQPSDENMKRRITYPKLLRQLVFPGSTDDQMCTVYSANLGNFRLIYWSETCGFEKFKLKKDLSKPEILKKCKPVAVHVFNGTKDRLNTDYRTLKWPIQALLSNASLIKVALVDENGVVNEPIMNLSRTKFKKAKKLCFQKLNTILSNISELMSDINDPYTVFIFTVEKGVVNYEKHSGRTEHCFLDESYINYTRNCSS